ncbi:MAG: MOSC N-terminal beta barrel domain-containing protein [Gemmatimonadales bacterium]
MHVVSLHRYPIKGCRGHALAVATLDALGVVGDRRMLLVDENDRFLTQREEPRLATLVPALEDDGLVVRSLGSTFEHEEPARADRRVVTIFGDRVSAADQGNVAAAWFTGVLGRPCRLVAFDAQSHRLVDPAYSPRLDAETAFTDGYPVLGVLRESLDDLNSQLDAPIPMVRFRPNVVLSGAMAWSEDAWHSLTIGHVVLDAVKPSSRCVVTTTDQVSGERHPDQEPLRTLTRTRLQRPLGAIFGQNLVSRNTGTMSVGDAVTCE